MRGASPEARDAPFAGEPNDLHLRVAWHDLARPEKPPSRRDVCDDGAVSTSLPRFGGPVVGGNGVPTVRATSFDLTPLGYVQEEFIVSGQASAFDVVGTAG